MGQSFTTIRQQFAILGMRMPSTQIIGRAATSGSVSTLVEAAWPIRVANLAKNDVFEGAFILRPAAVASGDRVRIVPPNTASFTAYAPTTGTFQPDANWANSPGTEAYELHQYGFDPWTQVMEIANQALKRIPLVAIQAFDPVEESTVQDVTAALSWLTNAQWIYQARYLPAESHETQTITESGSPGGGTFTLTYRGNTTGTIAFGASAATVQTALRALPGLANVSVDRAGTTTNFVWTVTFYGCGPYVPELTGSAAGLTGGSSPAITLDTTSKQGDLLDLTGRVYKDSDRVYVDFGMEFLANDWLYLTCRKPAYEHCRASSTGVFGDRASLAAEAHEAEPIVEWIVAGMLIEAWYRFPQALNDAVEKRRVTNLQEAWQAFERFKKAYFSPPKRTLTPVENNVPLGVS